MIDSTDKIYLTTNNGVQIYNGHDFKTFTTQDGLPTLFSWQLHMDEVNRLWLVNFETPFTYIRNGKVVRVGKKTDKFFTYNFVSSGDTTYANSLRSKSTALIVGDSLIKVIRDSICIGFHKNKAIFWSRDKLYDGFGTLYHFALNGKYLFRFVKDENLNRFCHIYDVETNEVDTVDVPYFKNKKINSITNIESGKISLNYKTGFAYVNTKVASVHDIKAIEHPSLDNVGGVAFDRNNQVWKANFEKGLIFTPSKSNYADYIRHPKQGKFVYANLIKNDLLVLIDEQKEVYYLKENKLQRTNQRIEDFNVATELIAWNNRLVVMVGGMAYFLPLNTASLANLESLLQKSKYKGSELVGELQIGEHISVGSLNGIYKTNEMLVLATGSRICPFEYKNEKVYVQKYERHWTNDYVIHNKDTFMCDHNGIFKRVNNEWKLFFKKEGVRSFFYAKDSLCFNTYSSKCYNLDAGLSIVEELQLFNQVKIIYNEGGDLVVQNGNEIYVLHHADLSVKEYYSTSSGFLGGKKLKYFTAEQNDYLISKEGVYTLSKEKAKHTFKSFLRLDAISLNGMTIGVNGPIKISEKGSQLELTFSVNVFPRASDIVYEYRFVPDGSWQKSRSNKIVFNGIPYDVSRLEVRAVNNIGKQYGKLLKIEIDNPTPFYKKGIFYLLLSLILLACMYWFLKRRENKRTRELKQENELLVNKQKMLGLQMKPHFLSNIFNNLQSSLLLDSPEETSEFVQQVNLYLRETLKASELEYISLAKEIEYVKNYIDLERRRVSKKITFEVAVKNSLRLDKIQVPVFCLQPIIENAIWHGIQASEAEVGIIKLSIEEKDNYYVISCADNGIGFNESKKVGNVLSLKNINQRMSLADTLERHKYSEVGTSQLGGAKISLYVPRKPRYYNH